MENKELGKIQNTENIKKMKKKEYHRVILTTDANGALEAFTQKLCDEFSFSSITKSDVANWLLERIEKKISTSEASEILESNFDETKALNELLKNHKNGSGELPAEISQALKSHLKLSRKLKKTNQ
ncbi:hypothetical protein K2X05_11955 [bacterium]|nr:hypothetical protein [bacterium]